ncbi:hypothetical protein BJ878DRAFT_81994 [Calycina marina]|uniref:Uncharacterized protein n=1 Tax=Calycina marina TaxID=1763456 RepID=A0A9P8CIM7_9HELO|nr:hypothetical protein BJ878DRAFT_81994 [Calycina marina]
MAFRQSIQQATPQQRIYTASSHLQPVQQPAQSPQSLSESQEWILFSPSAASITDRTYTTSTARTQTVGRSRISDFGSLDTAARSYDEEEEVIEEAEEDGELDSLDSHLHEFRTEPSVHRGREVGGILPTHDGLGSFRVDQTVAGEEMQAHLYSFERCNPRRVKRLRSSADLGILEGERESALDSELTRRIEQWRTEQSRVLVEEIQRETRRRRQSMSSERQTMLLDKAQEDVATLSDVSTSDVTVDEPIDNESFWNKITRRVIQDLMGIDDDLLSIIFGESLPEDTYLSTTPTTRPPIHTADSVIGDAAFDEPSWENKLLERIARELGVLVSQISDHPGAFSTYLQTQELSLPYAGLPVIPESALQLTNQPSLSPTSLPPPKFQHTIPSAQPIAIPASTTSFIADADATPRPTNTITQEDWERDLDIKMVYRYLRSRFTSCPSTPVPTLSSSHATSYLATAITADTAARAARVGQHHPLVSSRQINCPRTFHASVSGKEASHAIGKRNSSGCGSERSSGFGKRNSQSSSGSRHYWDFGHGHGTGSVGSWGLLG